MGKWARLFTHLRTKLNTHFGANLFTHWVINFNLPLKRGGRNMARRLIVMDEVLEVIYQWHKGQNNSQIAYSLGINRKMVKRYLHMVREIGLSREKPLPDDHEILIRLKEKGGLSSTLTPKNQNLPIFGHFSPVISDVPTTFFPISSTRGGTAKRAALNPK